MPGLEPIFVLAPGAQGPVGEGKQGCGVRTPMAAAVAAATLGLAGLVHIPKGMMFIMGTIAVILPIGVWATTLGMGGNLRAEGATPFEHMAIAPDTTNLSIATLKHQVSFPVIFHSHHIRPPIKSFHLCNA
jgi:hypothetical protein